MNKTKFKYVHFGETFKHEGVEYTKTSFQRGYHFENEKKKFRTFKKSTIIEIQGELWDC